MTFNKDNNEGGKGQMKDNITSMGAMPNIVLSYIERFFMMIIYGNNEGDQ